MFLLYFIIAVFLTYAIYVKENTFFSPCIIVVITWCIFPAIASLRPIGLNEISLYTHFVILLSLFIFVIAYFVLSPKSSGNLSPVEKSNSSTSQDVNYVLLLILNVAACVYLLPKTVISWGAIQMAGWDQVRFYSDDLFGSTGDNTIYQVFARPLFVASLALISVDVFRSFKLTFVKFLFILFVVINVAQESVIFAARATLVKIVIFLLLSFFFLNTTNRKWKNKSIWKLVVMLFAVFGVIAYITAGRNENIDDSDGTFLGTIIAYYIAPFQLLDYYLEHPTYALLGEEHLTYGTCIVGGIYNFFCMVATFLFKVPYAGTDYIITGLTQQPVYVAKTWELNAACTAAYPFIKDFGIFGIIIGFSLCALITVIIKRKYCRNQSLRNGALYVFILYTVFRLSEQYDFLFTSSIASIAYIYLGTMGGRKRNLYVAH